MTFHCIMTHFWPPAVDTENRSFSV